MSAATMPHKRFAEPSANGKHRARQTRASETPLPDGRGSDAAAAPTHDARGRFAKGNPGGPGNPHARDTARIRARFTQRMSDDKIDELFDALFAAAKAGDMNAAKLLLQHSMGKPAPAQDPDRVDIDEMKMFHEITHLPDAWFGSVKYGAVGCWLGILRVLGQVFGDAHVDQIWQGFQELQEGLAVKAADTNASATADGKTGQARPNGPQQPSAGAAAKGAADTNVCPTKEAQEWLARMLGEAGVPTVSKRGQTVKNDENTVSKRGQTVANAEGKTPTPADNAVAPGEKAA